MCKFVRPAPIIKLILTNSDRQRQASLWPVATTCAAATNTTRHGVTQATRYAYDPTGRCVAKSDADRKSTRLNSSHLVISYAVFCLNKKKIMLSEDTRFTVEEIKRPVLNKIIRQQSVGCITDLVPTLKNIIACDLTT